MPNYRDTTLTEVLSVLADCLSLSAHCSGERLYVEAALARINETLSSECAIFFPTDALRITVPSGMTMEMPKVLTLGEQEFFRKAATPILCGRDARCAEEPLSGLMRAVGQRSAAWVAVVPSKQHLGTLAFFHESAQFSIADVPMLRALAVHVGWGIEWVRMRMELAQADKQVSTHIDHYLENVEVVRSIGRGLVSPVTAMLGYLDLLKGETTERRANEYVEKLGKQVERVSEVVNRLNAPPKPQSAAAVEAKIAKMAPPVMPQGKDAARILLVQSNPAIASYERSVLSALGVQVLSTASCEAALQLLQSEKIDALILDEEMDNDGTAGKVLDWVRDNRPELVSRMLMTVSPSRKLNFQMQIQQIPKPLDIQEIRRSVLGILGEWNPPASTLPS